MSYLIFCSSEVGGFPYRMAEILNHSGLKTYYVSIDRNASGHDSTLFHYGEGHNAWNLSYMFGNTRWCHLKIIRTLRDIKKQYNIKDCLATGNRSYLLWRANIPYYYWSYGFDLDQNFQPRVLSASYPLWKKVLRYPYWKLKNFLLVKRLISKYLSYAEAVMIAPYQKEALMKLYPSKRFFFIPHFLKLDDFNKLMKNKETNAKKICEHIRATHFFFSSARQVWYGVNKKLADNKGNDIILKTFAEYLKISNERSAKLILVNKGYDVGSSRLLAKDLNIEMNIVWVDEMKRNDLYKYYQGAQMCFGQFGTPVLTHSALEPLSNATPCVSYFLEDTSGVPYYKETPPIFNSKVPVVIANFMSRVMNEEKLYSELCRSSWDWVMRNCSEEKFVESFSSLFKSIK